MGTNEVCEYLGVSLSKLRYMEIKLNIKGNGKGYVRQYSKLELARLKAGEQYKNHAFVQDIERNWIFYAMDYQTEIKIEL